MIWPGALLACDALTFGEWDLEHVLDLAVLYDNLRTTVNQMLRLAKTTAIITSGQPQLFAVLCL